MSNLNEETKSELKQKKEVDKAEKAKARAEAKAAREAARPAKHTAKLVRAKANLPELNDRESEALTDLTDRFGLQELEYLSAHLAFYVREKQTANAVGTQLTVGQTVRIKSGNQKHVGQIGTVTKAQRIRCYVSVPNAERDVYLFTSDVEPVNDTGEAVSSESDDVRVAV